MEDKLKYLLAAMEKLIAEREASLADDDPYFRGFTEGLEQGKHLVQCVLLAQHIEDLQKDK
jgi:hypothetical protein